MKRIYIVLTFTGTALANVVKFYTKKEYAHSSLSLDKELNQMYSFGRLNPYNPFIGGFVKEEIDFGTFKRFKKTTSEIYSLKITNEQYNIIQNKIEEIKLNKDKYKFNVLGMFFIAIHKKRTKENSFYCSEFVKYLLDTAKIKKLNLPELITPEDFKKIDNLKLEYMGLLKDYNKSILLRN